MIDEHDALPTLRLARAPSAGSDAPARRREDAGELDRHPWLPCPPPRTVRMPGAPAPPPSQRAEVVPTASASPACFEEGPTLPSAAIVLTASIDARAPAGSAARVLPLIAAFALGVVAALWAPVLLAESPCSGVPASAPTAHPGTPRTAVVLEGRFDAGVRQRAPDAAARPSRATSPARQKPTVPPADALLQAGLGDG